MHYRKLSLILLVTSLSVASQANFRIYHEVEASAVNPAIDFHSAQFSESPVWNNAGRHTTIAATSEGGPWDPPINIATASSTFDQPLFGDGTIRAMSFGLSDYSGMGLTQGFSARTSFTLDQRLVVQTGGAPGFTVFLKVAVPMHGLLAARGTTAQAGFARAEMGVKVRREDGVLLDESVGSLELGAVGFNDFLWNATGDWSGNVVETDVDLPTGAESRSSRGVELNSFQLLDLGPIQTLAYNEFSVDYFLTTSAEFGSTNGSFALSDFSGTGKIEFQAFDESGNRFYDFSVDAAPVPEPATLTVLGLAVIVAARRRRLRS